MKGRKKVRSLLVLIVLSLVVACTGETPQQETDTPESSEYPAVEEITVESTVEEITVEPTVEVETAEPVEPPSEAVALLVLDDFQTVLFELGGDTAEAPPQEQNGEGILCAVSPDGQIFRGEGLIFRGEGLIFRGEGLNWIKIAGVSHGDLVYSQLESLFAGSYEGPDNMSGQELFAELNDAGDSGLWRETGLDWMAFQIWYTLEERPLLLVAIDTEQYDSGIIAQRLQASMEALNSSEWNVRNFVWNMSFGFVPCDLEITEEQYEQLIAVDEELQALQQSFYDEENETQDEISEIDDGDVELFLRDYARLRHAYVPYDYDFIEPFNWSPDENDPVLSFGNSAVEIIPALETVIPVAASGNSGLDFPFAPARWPRFVSVSAEDPFEAVKQPYANDGEVIMPDGYEYLGNIIGGTSFAAPRLSFLAAQYLLSGGTVSCSGVVDTVEPPLNTTDLAGPWPNLPLADASNGYCSTFPPWPP